MASSRTGMTTVINFDRPCRGCGYNMRGLPYGAACPECDHAMKADRTLDEPIARQDEGVLRMLHMAMMLALVSWMSIVALLIAVAVGRVSQGMLIALLAAVAAFCTACWLLTPSIRHADAMLHGFGELAPLRWPVRFLPAGWLLACFAALGYFHAPLGQTGDATRTVMFLIGAGALLAGLGGVVLLAVHLRRLADWSRDGAAASAINLAAWLLCGLVPLVAWMIHWKFFMTGGVLEMLFRFMMPLILLAVFIGCAVLGWGLALLAGSLRLSIVHCREYRELDERRLARARKFECGVAGRSRQAGVP